MGDKEIDGDGKERAYGGGNMESEVKKAIGIGG